MLGEVSRFAGVQSYSERPKKSSNFDLIAELTRARVHESVDSNDLEAVMRMDPPRWEDLGDQVSIGALRAMSGRGAPYVCQSTF